MFDEHSGFLERALIGQKLDSFPRGELSAPVLGVDPLCSAAAKGTRTALREAFETGFHWAIFLVADRIARAWERPAVTSRKRALFDRLQRHGRPETGVPPL